MKKLFSLSARLGYLAAIIALIALSSQSTFSQISGTKTIPGDYATISAAITALNAGGVGAGGVTFNIAAGYVETMSAANYTINTLINQPSASNPVIFQKSGAGANPKLQTTAAGLGTITISSFGSNGDAFIKLNGTDYVTFDGIDMEDLFTGVVTLGKVEYGFMLCRASATDGCKNITIRNCRIVMALNSVTSVSAGIYTASYTSAGVSTSATSIGGRHENIFIDGNTIERTVTGMYFNGTTDAVAPYNLYDNNIQVGATTGNTIIAGSRTSTNTVTQYGIYAIYGDSVKFNNNTIRMFTGTNLATHYGIFTSTGTNSNIDIIGNTVSDSTNVAGSSQQIGIGNTFGASGTNNTVNILNNNVSNCVHNFATVPTVSYIQNSAGAFTINITGNTVSNNTVGAGTSTSTGTITGILQSTGNTTVGATLTVSNNTVNGLTRSQSAAGTGQLMGIQFGGMSYTTTVNNNSVQNLANGSSTTSTLAGIYNAVSITGGTYTFSNNTINNLTRLAGHTSGATYGLYTSNSTTNVISFGNTISNISTASTTSTGSFYGYYNFGSANSGVENFYSNTVFNISQTSTSTGLTYGAYIATGASAPFPTKQIYGNTIYNISGGTGQTGALYTNYAATGNIYKNRIYNISSSGTTGAPQTYGMLLQGTNTASIYNVYNNFVQEIKAPNGNPAAAPYGSIMGIWVNGGAQANIFNNTIYLDAVSVGANFGTMGLYCSITPTQNMQNNIIINKSTPNGGGLTIAFVRNGVSPGTYSASSDKNNLYAGAPGANRLLYYDYTNSIQTIAAYKSFWGTKDQSSVTENTAFINTAVSPYDLHLSTCTPSQCESGGNVVSTPISITDDYDGNARYPNAGYPQCSTYAATAPDIGADEFAGQFLDQIPPVISYTILGNTNSIANRSFTGVTITDAAGINVTSGTKPRCYYKKSTDANTYTGNTFFDNGWKWVESNGASSPFDFTIDYSIISGGSVTTGETVQYFVVAQDLASTPNVTINSGTPAGTVSSVADYGNIFPLGGTINEYNVSATYSGNYTVGLTGFDNFTSFTGAGGLFAQLNAGVMTGNITVRVTTNITEDGTNDLNNLSYDVPNANYTLKIIPNDASEKVISGSVAAGLMRFDGNDYVTIDGNNGLDASGTQYLRFRNTSAAGPTFSFFNDSKNNTITNCIIESNNVNVATLPGTILFGTTLYTDGNDNNTFSDCEIRDNSDASGQPTIAVFSGGSTSTVAQSNSNNSFTGCNIHDFFTNGQTANSAFYMSTGTTAWTISNNSIYQTSTRTTTVATGYNIVFLSNSLGDGFTITGNSIGGTAPNCGGTPWTLTTSTAAITNFLYAIRFAASGVTNASTISNNTIANFDITLDAPAAAGTLYFDAMLLSAGNINVSGNTIGSQSTNGNIKLTNTSGTNGLGMFGIDMRGVAGSITNNTVGGFTYAGGNTGTLIMVGINEGSTTATSVINVTGNTIGGSVSNSMYDSRGGVTIGQFTGIRSTQAGPTALCSYSNNTVRNMTDLGSGGGFMTGISHSGATPVSINNCTINDLNSGSSLAGGFSGTMTMCGISLTSTGVGASISYNTIYNINNTYTGVNNTYVHGFQVTSSSATVTETGNKIYGLSNQSTGSGVITGINQYWGAAGCTITNNQITITNGEATLDNAGGKKYINNHDNINPVKQNPLNQLPVNQNPVIKTPVNNIKKNTGEGSGNPGGDKKGGNVPNVSNDGLASINEDVPVTENAVKVNYEPQVDYTNGLTIYGMYNDATGIQNIYYNSIYVGGSASAGATNSYVFRKSTIAHNFINNLLVNARTNSGTATGKHYVMYSTATTAGSLNANYNVYIGSNASTIGLWNTTDQTFAQWKTSLARDQQSWSTTTSDINPSNLFAGISTGNLNINTANTEAWIVSGKGIAITGQSTDYSGDARFVSVGSGTTDIGSDEFGALGMNTPTASVDNPPGDGVISTYTLWGRPIVRIAWGTSGTLYPGSLNVYYNSGINPPNTLGGNYSNSHTIVNEVGGPLTGTTYDITYYFGDNETYTIGTPGASTILAKYGTGGTWEVYHLSQPSSNSVLTFNAATQTFNIAVSGLYDFSTFALTDDGSALPVTMESFDIAVSKRDAMVNWVTASEMNNKGFGVERRVKTDAGYSSWKEIGFINGSGTSNERHAYTLKDSKLNAGAYQYRLRQVDFNNNVEYFNPTSNTDVIIGKPGEFDVSQNYPNPSNPKSKIDFSMPFDGKVSIRVYDILGREVATLINEFKPADFYTVEFDGTNIASGTYFYRIVAEGDNQKFTKTLKMILVK